MVASSLHVNGAVLKVDLAGATLGLRSLLP